MRKAALAAVLSFAVSGCTSPARAGENPFSGARYFAAVLRNVGENGAADRSVLGAIAASGYDVVVIDNIATSPIEGALDPAATVRDLKASPGTALAKKLVLAYCDIGEAESYRRYWQRGWRVGRPSFIVANDPDGFAGNYPVNVADKRWQAIVFGSPTSLVDLAIANGFDGIFMDWVLGYSFDPVVRANPNARADTIAFIKAISAYAKARKPGFALVAQNAPGLASDPTYLAAVDAASQEDLWFSNSSAHSGDIPADPTATAQILQQLKRFKAAGKPIFAIDYATRERNVGTAYAQGAAHGLIEYVATRELGALTLTPPPGLRKDMPKAPR